MLLGIFSFLNMSLVDIIDILLVALFLYYLFKWMKNSSALNIFLAILLLLILRLLAVAFDMRLISAVLGTVLDVGVLALIVIFQPEIRRFLMRIGSGHSFTKIFKIKEKRMDGAIVSEIVTACERMSEEKTGALIVFPHKTSLQYIIETGDEIDSKISSRLLMNLFFKNSPLHDGAVIIGNGRVIAARCTLPITKRNDIPPQLGMRHKAAIGISEESDATVLVVSEETGRISFIKDGVVEPITTNNKLKNLLLNDGDETGEKVGV